MSEAMVEQKNYVGNVGFAEKALDFGKNEVNKPFVAVFERLSFLDESVSGACKGLERCKDA